MPLFGKRKKKQTEVASLAEERSIEHKKRRSSETQKENQSRGAENLDHDGAKVKFLLDEFDFEVTSRVQAMSNASNSLALSLSASLQIELLKLPPRIRSMTMQKFFAEETFVPSTVKRDVRHLLDGSSSLNTITRPDSFTSATPFSTPRTRGMLTRSARRSVLTETPLSSSIPDQPKHPNGIDQLLSDASRKDLSQQARGAAFAQLMALQAQVNDLMSNLQ